MGVPMSRLSNSRVFDSLINRVSSSWLASRVSEDLYRHHSVQVYAAYPHWGFSVSSTSECYAAQDWAWRIRLYRDQ